MKGYLREDRLVVDFLVFFGVLERVRFGEDLGELTDECPQKGHISHSFLNIE